MRYFVLGFALLFTAYAWADDYNESVAAISFNPSRMGTYSHLKIAHSADFTGGLNAEKANVNIMTKGTVTVSNVEDGTFKANCSGDTTAACYTIDKVIPMSAADEAEVAYCGAHATNCNTAASCSTQLTTDSGSIVQGAGTYVSEVPNIVNGSVWTGGNKDWPLNNDGITLTVWGGAITSNSSTFIKKLKGPISKITWKFQPGSRLIMNPGTTFAIGTATTGTLKLGGVAIPPPDGKTTKLQWSSRKDTNGNTANILTACTGC